MERTPSSSDSVPTRFASEFLSEFGQSGRYLRDNIVRLAQWATSEDAGRAIDASTAIFAGIIEPLSDSFEPGCVSVCNRALAQLIQHCRGIRRGKALDAELAGFGLMTEEDLFNRAERLTGTSATRARFSSHDEVTRAIVLSRITLGADVAITSVIVERLKQKYPNAEIVLAGGRKTEELFGGDPRLRFREIGYERGGAVVDRLRSWIGLLGCLRETMEGLAEGQGVIVDPDSRLTQLGLLPVSRSASTDYLFFPSRSYGWETSHSLGRLADEWLREVFGAAGQVLPRVNLASPDRETASALVKLLRQSRARPIVSVNFGVGENPIKRVGGEFEISLVTRLIQDGATVILDKGAGDDEAARANAVINEVKGLNKGGRAVQVVEVDEPRLLALLRAGSIDARVLVWNGRIGLLAAMIGESDLYIGYDSAGQHIAAALGVASIDVMAGFGSPRMLDRWRPTGRGEVRVVPVDTLVSAPDSQAVLSAVVQHARELLGG